MKTSYILSLFLKIKNKNYEIGHILYIPSSQNKLNSYSYQKMVFCDYSNYSKCNKSAYSNDLLLVSTLLDIEPLYSAAAEEINNFPFNK